MPEVAAFADLTFAEGEIVRFYLVHGRLEHDVRVSVTFTQSGGYASSREMGQRWVTLDRSPRTQTEIRIPTIDNHRDEANGTITMTINARSTYRLIPGYPASASNTVKDNDEPQISIGDPSISISAGSAIREGGTASFRLSANPRPAAPVTVKVNVTQHGDFLAAGQVGQRDLTIGTNGRGTLSVVTEDDGQDEPDGSITVSVVDGEGYSVAAQTSVTVVVTDGGAPTPRISLSAGPAIDEGGTASFTVTASPAPESDLAVPVTIAENGDFSASPTGTQTVTIGASGTATITVNTVDDGLSERDGSITATLSVGTEYLLTTSSSASVRVHDIGAPKVTISRSGRAIIEGETAEFTLTVSPPPVRNITVTVRIYARGDFGDSRPQWEERVTLLSGERQVTLPILTDDDEVDEHHGSLAATVLPGTSYDVGQPSSTTIQVNDNDAAANDRTVSVADASQQENARTPSGCGYYWTICFPITISRPTDTWIRVSYETREVDNGATAGADYRYKRSSVTFRPGEPTTKYAMVTILNDDDEEVSEDFELVLTNVTGPVDIADGVAVGTILPDPRDKPRPTPEITIDVQPAVVEGQAFRFTLTAMPPPEDDMEIAIRVSDGCDSEGVDFVASSQEGDLTVIYRGDASGIWTLPDGENYTREQYTIRTVNDRIDEDDGPVCVEVLMPDDGRYISQTPYRQAVIVYDNDGGAPVMPELFVSDGNGGDGATEESGSIQFSVRLSEPPHPDGKITVRYYALPGTARANIDFTVTAGTLTFYGGEDHKTVEVPIIDDEIVERDERFLLLLWGAQGATLGDRVGLGTILASDE